jgi:hypothetical protein
LMMGVSPVQRGNDDVCVENARAQARSSLRKRSRYPGS